MKTLGRTVWYIILVSILFQGCSAEYVTPVDQNAPALAGAFQPGNNVAHEEPQQLCGNPAQFVLTDQNGSLGDIQGRKYGEAIINNSVDSLYIKADLGAGWFVDKVCWYAGSTYAGPTAYNTNWTTTLPGNCNPDLLYNDWMVRQEFSGAGNCKELVLAIEIIRIHHIYGPNEATRCWVFARSSAIETGVTISYCTQACPVAARPETTVI